MIKSILMLLFFAVLFSVPARAQSADDRYLSYTNGMLGKPWASTAAEQANRRKVSRATVLGGQPAGCPARAWCGCFLSKHLGLHRRDLWLARNWALVGSPTGPRPGAIVVWRRHVGKVTAVNGGMIRVLSGNDGRRVRERWRSARGVIAYRAL